MPGGHNLLEDIWAERRLEEVCIEREVLVHAICETGDNTEAGTTPAAKSPKEVRVASSVRSEVLTIRSNDCNLEDVVDAKSKLRAEDVVSTAKRPTTCCTDSALSTNTTSNGLVYGANEAVKFAPLDTRADGHGSCWSTANTNGNEAFIVVDVLPAVSPDDKRASRRAPSR